MSFFVQGASKMDQINARKDIVVLDEDALFALIESTQLTPKQAVKKQTIIDCRVKENVFFVFICVRV